MKLFTLITVFALSVSANAAGEKAKTKNKKATRTIAAAAGEVSLGELKCHLAEGGHLAYQGNLVQVSRTPVPTPQGSNNPQADTIILRYDITSPPGPRKAFGECSGPRNEITCTIKGDRPGTGSGDPGQVVGPHAEVVGILTARTAGEATSVNTTVQLGTMSPDLVSCDYPEDFRNYLMGN